GHAVVRDPHAAGQQRGAAVVADHAMLPAGDLAAGVGRGLQALERLRAESALRQVLLTGPDQLDRALDLARDQRGLDRFIAAVSSADAAAHVALVVGNLFFREPERLRYRGARNVGGLAAFPDLDAVAGIADTRHRVERLHLRVIAEVAAEFGFVNLGCAGERRLGVARRLHGRG